ncbi:HNH endonuclease [Pseudomonas sp. LTJR-52]|uniref:HNH endonuclease n=1 Tax=Pseudomonas sp. LTJR-52 TaxID=2479392 RepID=UPI0013CEE92A|nr:HNH endonuclease [Pseudomonas sp. LTJR-52]
MNQDELKRHIHYDPESGIITRLSRRNSAGSFDTYGYLIIKIKGRQYKAHRLCWLYVHGVMPDGNIDHINGIRSDNRIANLRVVSQADNCRNSTIKPHPSTGFPGVLIDNTNGLKKRYAFKFKGETFRFYDPETAYLERVKLLKENGYGERHYKANCNEAG